MAEAAFPAPLDEAARAQSWAAAWSALDRPEPPALRHELETAWAEPHRHYHDARHLGECLALWARWQVQTQRPAEVALALWFHDAVHDPLASGNEINSAVWAARSLVQAGLPSATAQRVFDLVLATRPWIREETPLLTKRAVPHPAPKKRACQKDKDSPAR